jgi:hypothetical protein
MAVWLHTDLDNPQARDSRCRPTSSTQPRGANDVNRESGTDLCHLSMLADSLNSQFSISETFS